MSIRYSPAVNKKCKWCPNIAVPDKDVCLKHSKIRTLKPKFNRKRTPRTRKSHPLYATAAWARFRRSQLDKFPLCFGHLQKNQAVAANSLDHIVPLWYAPKQGVMEEERTQSLCRSCHSKKTLQETFKKIAIDYKHGRIIKLK